MVKKNKPKPSQKAKAKPVDSTAQLKSEVSILKREIQIEAALEKVRSHSMAMQKSEDLKDVIQVVFNQLVHVGIKLDHAGFVVDYKLKGDWHFWIADKQEIPSKISHPYFDSIWAKQFNDAKKKRSNFFTTLLNFKEKNKFYRDLFKYVPGVSAKSKKFYFESPGLAISNVLLKNVAVYIENFSAIPYTEEENHVLLRFGKVFEQAYTRFLDLQKAEAQAREAQIEAALEQIRARAMAMKKSNELAEVAELVYLLLKKFGLINDQKDSFHIAIHNTEKKNTEVWTTQVGGKTFLQRSDFAIKGRMPKALEINYGQWFNTPMHERKNLVFSTCYKGKALKQLLKWISQNEVFDDLVRKQRSLTNKDSFYMHEANFSHGVFVVDSGDDSRPEMMRLFQRFATVFEQTYARFLDLQKAEAQAREAQIEAALERVRSRSSAMHKSNELVEVVILLNEEVGRLGIKVDNTSIITDFAVPENGLYNWIAVRGMNYLEKFHVPYPKKPDPVLLNFSMAREKGIDFYVEKYAKAEKNKYFRWLFKYSDFRKIPEDRKQMTLIAPGWSRAIVLSKNSALIFQRNRLEEYTEEETGIFKRFGKVFEQAYTRFLDLQKAEAQAREAQLEAALEKIRSASLAMHATTDLINVVTVLREQMGSLGQAELESSIIHLYKPNTTSLEAWWSNRRIVNGKLKLITGVTQVQYESLWAKEAYSLYQSDQESYLIVSKGKMINEWYRVLERVAPEVVDYDKNGTLIVPKILFYQFTKFSGGALLMITEREPSSEAIYLQKRAANVFNIAYQRFLDLQKAETQARDAKIEAALEKVRSSAMAMHNSEELKDVVKELRKQIELLGQKELDTCVIQLYDESTDFIRSWAAMSPSKKSNEAREFFGDIPKKGLLIQEEALRCYASGQKDYTLFNEEQKLKQWMGFMKKTYPDVYKVFVEFLNGPKPEETPTYWSFSDFNGGSLLMVTVVPPTEASKLLLKKFASVFGLAYRRFVDLKQAEAQAREAQIEAALEMVRTKSFIMSKPEEINIVINSVYSKLKELDVIFDRAMIMIKHPAIDAFTYWLGGPEGLLSQNGFEVSYFEHPYNKALKDNWKNRTPQWTYLLAGAQKKAWDDYAFTSTGLQMLPDFVKSSMQNYGDVTACIVTFDFGFLLAGCPTQITENQFQILQRFGAVFDQSYKRFLDLQKAEAQAREAQVEAALEKVRSRTMAMQNSNELQETAAVLFKEFKKLGTENISQVTIGIYDEERSLIDFRVTSWTGSGEQEDRSFHLDMNEPSVLKPAIAAWKANKKSFVVDLTGEKLEQWIEYRNKMSGVTISSKDTEGRRVITVAYFSRGHISISSPLPQPEETVKTLERFATVFDGTYTRFLDLERAEAQAREAQIEAALERVRANAMAMHNSDEVGRAIHSLFVELGNLNLKMIRCGIIIIQPDQYMQAWTTSITDGDQVANVSGKINMSIHPLLLALFETWESKQDFFFYELEGKDSTAYYRALSNSAEYKLPNVNSVLGKHYCQAFMFEEGGLYAFTQEPIADEEKKTYKRFANVFTLTYRRYQDLQQAETRTKEAVKQAALDRVRADIASMRSVKDLDRITPLIWNELTSLAIPFVRCGVFIMHEETKIINMFLSTPDGRAIAAIELPYDSISSLADAIDNWRVHKTFIIHWLEKDFTELADRFVSQGMLPNREQYLKTIPKEGIHLHFLPFMQGMLYVGNTTQLNDEQMELIQSVADAFSTAYARYEDFNRLEAAKKQVDNTLTELKQAQQQLVQNEKMASLGELTAGIAHEIQNPLNFVNNFSEVNKELLNEMEAAIQKGDFEEAKQLAKDIADNQEKINHHGKRAEGIVKSMLQHSRTTSGQKESIDINALCDEYLRLSYHGYRAKDKSFNAKFEINLDKTLPKVNVVPQDLGRVILNLINNAFYAVNEKAKIQTTDYKPEVIISTRNLANRVEISVKDNGNGIPDAIKEKIFQPFFTTKPTGQGTGLGLSLSYDIVKAHGGELKVETKEGEGSIFIIQLPNGASA